MWCQSVFLTHWLFPGYGRYGYLDVDSKSICNNMAWMRNSEKNWCIPTRHSWVETRNFFVWDSPAKILIGAAILIPMIKKWWWWFYVRFTKKKWGLFMVCFNLQIVWTMYRDKTKALKNSIKFNPQTNVYEQGHQLIHQTEENVWWNNKLCIYLPNLSG